MYLKIFKCINSFKDKEDVVHIYTMEYYSAIKRNETRTFVEMWMELEFVTQSEVSQKEKNKYHILMHLCGIWKDGTDECICRAGTETQIQRMDVWTQEEGEGGMN